MHYVDDQIVESFRISVAQELAEAMEFALTMRQNEGEDDENELRQAAQDVLMELLFPLVRATEDAYARSPLGKVDHEAVAFVYKRVAIRAKLNELVARPDYNPNIVISTRRGDYKGVLRGFGQHDGQDAIEVGNEWVAVDSIQELHVGP